MHKRAKVAKRQELTKADLKVKLIEELKASGLWEQLDGIWWFGLEVPIAIKGSVSAELLPKAAGN